MILLFEIWKFLGVLSFLVTIHELGHFLVAKFFGVHVEEFGLGYPPRAKKLFTWKKTLFSLNWIPFGGFVKLEGEDGPEKKVSKSTRNSGLQPFYAKSAPVRLMIILAGAVVNFLFGVLAFAIYFSVLGIPVLVSRARVGAVAENSPAAIAHLPTDVEITSIQINKEFVTVHEIKDVTEIIEKHAGEKVTITTTGHCDSEKCDPGPQKFEVLVRKKNEIPAGQGAIGITFEPVIAAKFYPWYEMPFQAAWYGLMQAVALMYFILTSLGQIVVNVSHGVVPEEVAGPIGIFTQAHKAGFFSHGFLEVLNLTGLLSVNLAIMNVLPIPALDGGRAAFIILEKIIGKRRVEKFEGYANYGGFAVLITLVVLVTLRDIWGIFVH